VGGINSIHSSYKQLLNFNFVRSIAHVESLVKVAAVMSFVITTAIQNLELITNNST